MKMKPVRRESSAQELFFYPSRLPTALFGMSKMRKNYIFSAFEWARTQIGTLERFGFENSDFQA